MLAAYFLTYQLPMPIEQEHIVELSESQHTLAEFPEIIQ